MTTQIVKSEQQGTGIVVSMANRYGLEANKFMATVKATVFPAGKEISNEQAAAFLVVANQYELNPFTKEIYAFPGRNGGIVPIVSVDGWATLINRQVQMDGTEFQDHLGEQGELTAITCRIYRKDRSKPTEVTEYMDECHRDTDTWRKYPARMLRHKAFIQCARYAFGLTGIYDEDEAERITEAPLPSAPPRAVLPESISPEVGEKIKAFHDAAEKKGLNNAARHMLLGKHEGNTDAAMKELESLPVSKNEGEPAKPKKGRKANSGAPTAPEPAKQEEPKPAEADQSGWNF